MKKLLCSIVALLGFTAVSAATVDDLKTCQHSKIFVMDNYTGNGTGSRTKGGLAFSGYFLDVTGGSVATNKGSIDLSDQVTLETYEFVGCTSDVAATLVSKYGKYGKHLNSLRIKKAQDVFAIKVTAGSKVYFLGKSGGGNARYPTIASDASMSNVLSSDAATTAGPWVYCYTASDDRTIYVGAAAGDTYISYVIVEANEAPGTPTVEVSDMAYDAETGLYYMDVTCTCNAAVEGGESTPTVCTYTTDGSTPTASSPVYSTPIRCYENTTVKFQAYMEGFVEDGSKLEGADNEAVVEFTFDAPSITVNGATFTIESPYNNATNYYTLNGGEEKQGNGETLTSSATVTAYSKITNGSYATFTTPTASSEVYVLTPITSEQTVSFTGDKKDSIDATTEATVYYLENGAMTATNPECFYLKYTSEFGAVADKYQAPSDAVAYLKMTGNTFLTFMFEEVEAYDSIQYDSIHVIATCSKNSAKSLDDDGDKTCAVNVSGTTHSNPDVTVDGGNVIEFNLGPGTYTFQKYSGTGNIYLSSVVITPFKGTGITKVEAAENTANDNFIYNVAGQRVNANAKGLLIKNRKVYINK